MPRNPALAQAVADRELIEAAVAAGKATDIPVVAAKFSLLNGTDVESDEALYGRVALLELVPHPLLAAYMRRSGATPLGTSSWVQGTGEETFSLAPFTVAFETVDPALLWPVSLTEDAKQLPRDLHKAPHTHRWTKFVNMFAGTQAYGYMYGRPHVRAQAAFPEGAEGAGALVVDYSNGRAYFKVRTCAFDLPEHLPQIPLNLNPLGKKPRIDPKPVRVAHAVAVCEWLEEQGIDVYDEDPAQPYTRLRERLATSVVAYPMAGSPGLAEVSVGSKVRAFVDLGTPAPLVGETATRGQATALDVEAALRAASFIDGALHPTTRDVGRMALAEPFLGDERLRDYQKQAVGRHLSTTVGMLNATSPGMGKTIMSLVAMRQRALHKVGYRGLVIVEANVRDQWTKEADKWFPEAQLVTIRKRSDALTLEQTLAEVGHQPLVVICSYAMLSYVNQETVIRSDGLRRRRRTAKPKSEALQATTLDLNGQSMLFDLIFSADAVEDAPVLVTVDDLNDNPDDNPDDIAEYGDAGLGEMLLDTFWHDLMADEAEVLRSTGTKQGNALWDLRGNAEVAVALTGTPINRSLDDLGRLVAWCRNDPDMFYGCRLSLQYNLDDDEDLERFRVAMGPVMFRADTSEVADEVPTITPVVMKLTPSPAEKSLAEAARGELKRVYEELLEALEAREDVDREDDAYGEVLSVLKKARGAHLGGTTLARMAASDPAALLTSESAGALLLAGQGLVAAATQETGTKRAAVVDYTMTCIEEGEPVLIFTEFATVAAGLISDLDDAGIRVGAVIGGGGAQRDAMVRQFQTGDLDVLVCTSSGERGLNLQRAAVVVHYDLPWAPKSVVQRTGRALRLESTNQQIKLVFPIMEGTIEERVAATVVRRAIDAMNALDRSRGVDASKTELGLALGGLAEAVIDTADGRAHGDQMLEMTRLLVG